MGSRAICHSKSPRLDGVPEKKTVKVFSDCLYSLQGIHTFRSKVPLVLANKEKLSHLGGLACLVHVSCHTGVTGNVRVDVFTKKGTSLDVTKKKLPLSKSCIKNILK